MTSEQKCFTIAVTNCVSIEYCQHSRNLFCDQIVASVPPPSLPPFSLLPPSSLPPSLSPSSLLPPPSSPLSLLYAPTPTTLLHLLHVLHPPLIQCRWNFTCCNVESLVRFGLGLDNSTAAEVEGFGFYADDMALFQSAFHVDQLSFTSVERDLIEVRN